jgi:SPP1 gp7 family putative phage head morphogenesis protein
MLTERLIELDDFYTAAFSDDCCRITLKEEMFSTAFKKIPDNIQADFINSIFHDTPNHTQHRQALWNEMYKGLKNQAEAGYTRRFINPESNDDFALMQHLSTNIGEFTSHKIHTLTASLKKAKEQASGNRQVFEDSANILMTRHNERYLEVEERAAFSLANAAEKWQQYEEDIDIYPNLKYQTIGDGRVRDTHAAMDNMIRPINDPIWHKWYPPNGWRCRCITLQSDDEPRDGEGGSDIPEPDKGFAHNPGITKKLWDEQHPYFKTDAKTTATLKEEADIFRAQHEKNQIQHIARGRFTQNTNLQPEALPNPYHLTDDTITNILDDETHAHIAIKNALLTSLDMITPNLSLLKSNNRTYHYTYSLDAIIYILQLDLDETTELFVLTAILENL